MSSPIVRADGDGEQRWFSGGGRHTWKATSEETDGAFLRIVSNFKIAAWLSRYLRWYFLAFGPKLDLAELNRRTGRNA